MTFQLFTFILFYIFYLYCPLSISIISLYKLNIIIIIIYCYYYICAQFVNNCLQSYNELHVCGNLMCNTHSIGNNYLANIYMYI